MENKNTDNQHHGIRNSQLKRTSEEMFLNRTNITFEGQNKWWKALDKLTCQGHLNLNEWKDQEVLRLSKNNTANTDKPQKEGINSFNEENRCNVGNIINHTASLK